MPVCTPSSLKLAAFAEQGQQPRRGFRDGRSLQLHFPLIDSTGWMNARGHDHVAAHGSNIDARQHTHSIANRFRRAVPEVIPSGCPSLRCRRQHPPVGFQALQSLVGVDVQNEMAIGYRHTDVRNGPAAPPLQHDLPVGRCILDSVLREGRFPSGLEGQHGPIRSRIAERVVEQLPEVLCPRTTAT